MGLSYINRESIDAIRTAIWELEKAGYITRRQGRDDKGKMTAIEYTIYEQPQPPPELENPTTANPTLENPMQLNKEIQRTDLPKTDLSTTDLSNTQCLRQSIFTLNVCRFIGAAERGHKHFAVRLFGILDIVKGFA